MAHRYEMVFLDVGETLTYPYPSFHAIIARVLQDHGIDVTAEQVARVEHRVWAGIEERRRNGVVYALAGPETRRFWLDAYSLFVHHLGVADSGLLAERLCDEFIRLENWRLHDDVLPAIRRLRAAGYRLGIISNWEDWLEDLLLFLGIRSHFDLVVFSARENIAKPDPRLYERAIEAAGIEASRAIHAGDDPVRDVAPARQVGLTPVLIDRHGRYPSADCLRVTDLRQLPDLLATLPT